MNQSVILNFSKLSKSLLLIPLFLIILIIVYLFTQDALSIEQYISIQKDLFYIINQNLGQYPTFQYNLTQIGDCLIFFALVSVFFIVTPKLWEALLSGSLISLIFSSTLKKIFAIPRPAAALDIEQCIIAGKILKGHNSLPSGHSITTFTILTVLLFAFMPQLKKLKFWWILAVLTIGFVIVFSRVGVGAHYPLDVICGSIIGFLSGLLGIFFNQKYPIWKWINEQKYYPIFMLLFLVSGILIIQKLTKENLMIYYVALATLGYTLYKITTVYVKKRN